MRTMVTITVDTNDGDYEVNAFDDVSNMQVEMFERAAAEISRFKPYTAEKNGIEFTHNHNFPLGEFVRSDLGEKSANELYGDFDWYEEFLAHLPASDWGCHTVVSIEVIRYVEKRNLITA